MNYSTASRPKVKINQFAPGNYSGWKMSGLRLIIASLASAQAEELEVLLKAALR